MKAEVWITPDELLGLKHLSSSMEDFPLSFSALPGAGYSRQKGEGYDLYGIRPYQSGDSLRRVNRLATARLDKLYLNEFMEERQLAAHILIDQSACMFFSSTLAMKSVVAAKTGIRILFDYLKNGHRVSGEVFSDSAHSFLPLTSGETVAEEWVAIVAEYSRRLADEPCMTKKETLPDALTRCLEIGLSDREIYVVSDFMPYAEEALEKQLGILCRQNRLYLIQTSDLLEENPPLRQWLTDGVSEWMFHHEKEREEYQRTRREKKERLIQFCKENEIMFHENFT